MRIRPGLFMSALLASALLAASPPPVVPAQAQATATRGLGLRVVARDPATNQTTEVKLYNKSYAVIIGIDNYPNLPPDRQLSYAVRDARGIEATLKRLYKFDRIITLYNEQATKSRILELLTEELPAAMGEEDALFLFWAGHGNQKKYPEGDIGYLIPYDGEVDRISSNLTMTEIKDTISKMIPAKHVFYVMDACYSGLLTATRAVDRKPRRDLAYLKDITKERVRQVLTAGDRGQEVLDGGPKGHSVFTGRLIEILEATGDYVTANEIQAIIKEKVYGDARARNHEQKPGYGTLYGSGDFVFVPSVEQKVKDNQAELARLEAELKKIKEQEEQARQYKDEQRQREAEFGRKAAEARLKAEQLRKEQLAEEARRLEEDQESRARFETEQRQREAELDQASKAEEARLAALKAEVANRKTVAGPAAGAMTIKAAVAEVKRLNSEIEAIEAAFAKELGDGQKRITGRYDTEIAKLRQDEAGKKKALKKDEFETDTEFGQRVEAQTSGYAARIGELAARKQEELTALDQRLRGEQQTQTVGLRETMTKLAEQEFPLPADQLTVDLGQYDLSRQAFPVSIASLPAAPVKVAMNGLIPLPRETARSFKQQYASGLVRPHCSVTPAGVKVALANDGDGSILAYEDGEFMTMAERARRLAEERLRQETGGMEFVKVPAGCFRMGDTFGDGSSNERPVHEVCLAGFMVGKYEVTQGQWRRVMGDNPAYFKNCGENCPVEQVSWDDVQEFIKKLNSQTGGSYSLPTEAEWEYAARSGGQTEKWAGTSREAELGDYAWYNENSAGKTHPVGEKRPNGLGLHDMSGNVWEWVEDIYSSDAYESLPKGNPIYNVSGSSRVLRGGSWSGEVCDARAASRSYDTPDGKGSYLGFRLVRTK